MNLLIISNSYYPDRNARAFRWAALAEHWAAQGHKVRVVTGAVAGSPETENARGVMIHRIGGKGTAALRSRLASAEEKSSAPGKPSIVRRMLKAVHDLTWKKLYWPDSTALWIWPAVKKCKVLLGEDPASTIITVSLPFSGQVVGLLLRRYVKNTPWIMDIGDPFAFMVEAPTNNHTLYGRLNFAVEGKAVRGANAISVTTEGTLRRYLAAFPGIAEKIREIPPLVNLPSWEMEPAKSEGPIRLVYVGSMYLDVRGPELLLDIFERMVKLSADVLELHLYGNHLAYKETFSSLPKTIKGRVHLHGLVSREEAVSAMRSASALVNIGNDTTYQLPSKLVEYASVPKPIINVVSRQNDSSVAFLRRHPCVFNVIGADARSESTAQSVLNFLKARSAPSDCPVDQEWLKRFSLESIAQSYESLLTAAESNLASVGGQP